jgi:hypothetical protein
VVSYEHTGLQEVHAVLYDSLEGRLSANQHAYSTSDMSASVSK